jgi:hypothetical protein
VVHGGEPLEQFVITRLPKGKISQTGEKETDCHIYIYPRNVRSFELEMDQL